MAYFKYIFHNLGQRKIFNPVELKLKTCTERKGIVKNFCILKDKTQNTVNFNSMFFLNKAWF